MMSRFTSTYLNKVDRKGRVSVPAPFRTVLDGQGSGVFYLKRNEVDGTIDGLTEAYMDDVQDRIDALPMNSPEREDAEDEFFADSTEMRCDPDGRIILPKALMELANIDDQALFVGKGKSRFQIWHPETYHARRAERASSGRPNILHRANN
ncbi:MAG: division/cell wall cluster transcriptional repressor MraZ [Pseudomonadota bacterium]